MSTSQKNSQKNNAEIIDPRQLLLHEIAHKLVEARTATQQGISKPVRQLKIQANHLQALESGNWENLPDDVYVIGFLRQYSKYLDIDLSDEIDRLKKSDYKLTRPLTFPDPPVAPSRMWAWLTGGAFVVLFILFNVISTDDHQEDRVQSSDITPVAHRSAQTTDKPNSNAAASVHKDVTSPTVVKERPAVTTKTTTVPANKPTTSNVATLRSSDSTVPAIRQTTSPAGTAKVEAVAVKHADKTSNSSATDNTPKTASKTVTVLSRAETSPSIQNSKPKPYGKTAKHVFRFEAVTAPVWMQLFLPNKAGNGKGRLLKEMLLKKGHFANIRYATETLWITCGNALALRIKVDRKTIVKTGGLGNGKKILRDYRFDINDL